MRHPQPLILIDPELAAALPGLSQEEVQAMAQAYQSLVDQALAWLDVHAPLESAAMRSEMSSGQCQRPAGLGLWAASIPTGADQRN